MSLTLDDLGRAAFESVPELKVYASQKWGDMDNDSRRVGRAMALAAVERFAEALVDDVLYFDELHPKEKIRQLLASLRDEAGQKGGHT